MQRNQISRSLDHLFRAGSDAQCGLRRPGPARPVALAAAMPRGANNYDLLRLLLALAVIFGHSGALNPGHAYRDPVAWLIGFDYSGGVAVKAFFFLSGLFVTDSIVSRRSALRFAVLRAARIFPGLCACLLLCVCAVGPLFTELPLAEYARNPLTPSYVTANLSLTDLQWRLPGVFADSQYGLNGSLWTLPVEVRLYGCILLLHGLGALATRTTASLAIGLAGGLVIWHPDLPYGGSDAQGPTLCFILGVACAVHKRSLPVHPAVVLGLWACAAAAWRTRWLPAMVYPALFHSLLYAFQLPVLRRLRLPGDYSYGVYIYGFVVQQVFANLFPAAHPLANAAVCMPVATGIAALSWHWVEKPALASAHRFLTVPGEWRDPRTIAPPLRRAAALLPLRRAAALLAWPALALLAPQALRLVPGFGEVAAASPDLRVLEYGPPSITHGQSFNRQPDGSSAIWARLSRPVPPDAQLRIGATGLPSHVSGDLITALVPDAVFAKPGRLALRVVEHVRGRPFASAAVPWLVR